MNPAVRHSGLLPHSEISANTDFAVVPPIFCGWYAPCRCSDLPMWLPAPFRSERSPNGWIRRIKARR